MASEPNMDFQFDIITDSTCKICEKNPVSWKCFNCEEYLCRQCKTLHMISNSSKDHKIEILDYYEIQQAGDIEETNDDAMCKVHPWESITMFCQECGYLLCTVCIVSGSHIEHSVIEIKDTIDEKQAELSSIIKASNRKLFDFNENIELIQTYSDSYSKAIDKCIDDVKARHLKLQFTLDQITNNIIAKLKKMNDQNIERLRQEKDEIVENITELNEMLEKCMEKQSGREIEMVQFVYDIKHRLTQLKPSNPPEPPTPPVFVTRDLEVKQVKDMFGDLELEEEKGSDYEGPANLSINTDLPDGFRVISSFVMGKTRVATINDNQAWVLESEYNREKDIQLITTDGKVLKTINTDFSAYDLAVTKSDELLATVCSGNKIKKLVPPGRFIDLYVNPSNRVFIRGITVTESNEITVCSYNPDLKEGSLLKLTLDGEVTASYIYDTDGKTPLLVNPWTVTSNKNNDMIVIDDTAVVAIDQSGHKRFTYKGKILRWQFRPMYAATNKHGHIFMSDWNNSAVHLLDRDGNFIRFIMSADQGLLWPAGLSINTEGTMLVCSWGNEKIMVLEYVRKPVGYIR